VGAPHQWLEVEGLEVADGVQQLTIPMRFNPLGRTYCYLLTDSSTLIDTGVPGKEAYAALEKQLAENGVKPSDIRGIILTHLHNDHVGLVNQIKHYSLAKVFAHSSALERLREQAQLQENVYEMMTSEIELLGCGNLRQFLSRFEYSFRETPEPTPIDVTLEDREVMRFDNTSIEVLWTPGHAQEHICLYDGGKRILFSGDHVLPKITSNISLHTYQKGDPLADYLSSLSKVENLSADLVLPGHEWTFTNLYERVQQLKTHHKVRCDEVKEALKAGERTVYQVSSRISWDSRPWPFMNFWTKRMAAAETYAHLIYMRNRGEVSERVRERVLYYGLA
jgi:glyoxylase-like metal-dependent hydrolase (beta-lactamase superfamily II)